MDGASLARMRWRLRGAWLWPSFVILTAVDAVIGHLLPPVGESQSAAGAWLVALFLNLVAIAVLAPSFGMFIRRRRPDLPKIVARDYGGTLAMLGITAMLLVAGFAHRPAVVADHAALLDAVARAQAYIGDRAPDEFRRNLADTSTYEIVPGSIFRTCVRSPDHVRTYCVVVQTRLPFGRSVTFAGYESNALFSRGAW
jgi:hypothetical protein